MNNPKADTFEAIAMNAVKTLTSVILTLQITGGLSARDADELAVAIAADTEALCRRALALGAE